MSVHISSRAWLVQGLSFAEKLVLVKLADMANDEGVCWPSTATIGAQCGLDRRSVRRIFARLEAAGHLHRRARFNEKGLNTSNWLTVLPPADRRADAPVDGGQGGPDGPPLSVAGKGDRPVRGGRTGRSSLGGTGRSSKPSLEPSLNLGAREVVAIKPRRLPHESGGGACRVSDRRVVGVSVDDLGAFQRHCIRSGQSALVGGVLVRAGSPEMRALARALRVQEAGERVGHVGA